MSTFAQLSVSERAAFVGEAAARLDVLPAIVEKDSWVCSMLRQIFRPPQAGTRLVFKGGTSLSKVLAPYGNSTHTSLRTLGIHDCRSITLRFQPGSSPGVGVVRPCSCPNHTLRPFRQTGLPNWTAVLAVPRALRECGDAEMSP